AYVQGYGNPASRPDYQDVSFFGEDNWRATRAMSVRLGVRYQRQFWAGSTFHMPAYGEFVMAKDRNNLAPRLTVSWDPFSDGRTSVHGSYGVLYGNVILGVFGDS